MYAAGITTALGLLAVIVLIAANGAFVAAEFALVAADRSRVSRQASEGNRSAQITESLLARLSFHLSGAQLGITVTSLVLGFLAEPVVAALLEPIVGRVVGDERAGGISVVLALVVATVVQMVMGELVPKSLAIASPVPTAYALARPVRIYGIVAGPVVRMLNGVANWSVRRMGMEPAEELRSVRSLDELDFLFQSSGEEGHLDPESLTLLTRSVRFNDKTAADALVPRTDIVALSVDDTVADLAARAIETGHSRFPIYRGDLDQIEGIGHVKDAFTVPFRERSSRPVRTLMADTLVVPETLDLTSVLTLLQERATHLAVVIDEYGGTAGLLTLEDIIEEIVGEIDDEHDPVSAPLTRVQRAGVWRLSGGLHPDEVFDACGFEIPDGPYETLAGYVLATLGHIPSPGEQCTVDGWKLTVGSMERHRIAEVELVAAPVGGPSAPTADRKVSS